MKRIMIIGGSGSGKSTLARRLGATLGLPVYHMEREMHWLRGWVERPKAEKTPLAEAVVARDVGVFEGGHSATYPQRLARADLLIWTDAPLFLRLWRITSRSLRHHGESRPDRAEDYREKLSNRLEFWHFLWANRHRYQTTLKHIFAAAPIPKRKLNSFCEINALEEDIS